MSSSTESMQLLTEFRIETATHTGLHGTTLPLFLFYFQDNKIKIIKNEGKRRIKEERRRNISLLRQLLVIVSSLELLLRSHVTSVFDVFQCFYFRSFEMPTFDFILSNPSLTDCCQLDSDYAKPLKRRISIISTGQRGNDPRICK